MPRTAKEYYAILEVAYGADAATLKKAFRRLAKKYHPDANSGNKMAENKFKDINEAYSFLSDPDNLVSEPPAPAQPMWEEPKPTARTDRKQHRKPFEDLPDDFDFFPEGASGNQVQFWGMEFIIGLLIVLGLFVFLFPGPRSSMGEKNGKIVEVSPR
jgi:hypothetical protein